MNQFFFKFSLHHPLFLSNEDSCSSRLEHFGRKKHQYDVKCFKKEKNLKIMFFFLKIKKFVIFKIEKK